MVHCINIHGRNLVLLVLLMVGTVRAHTYLSSLIVNGNALPEFDGLRPHPHANKEYPLADLKFRPNGIHSNDMTCGFLPDAARPANRKIRVEAGSKVGFQWWHTPGHEVVPPSHHGPCLVYMAKSETGAGPVWFKIFEKGYDASRRKWCVDDVVDARGVLSGVTIPADLSPGNYLLRAELIALHDADKMGGAQPYAHCAEITLTGSGSANPPGVAIPGVYKDKDLHFDLYHGYNSYKIPGPPVYVPGSPYKPSSSPSPSSRPRPTSTPTPSSRRCPVSIRQSSADSWSEGGKATTRYKVVMTNKGSLPLNLKFRLSAKPKEIWSLKENRDGTYSLPRKMKGKLRKGQAFEWGYVVHGRSPLKIQLVNPSCRRRST